MAPHKLLHLIQRQASCQILAPELGSAFDGVPALRKPVETQRGKDYEFAKHTGLKLPHFKNELLGCGPFLHNDPRDRPASIFGGRTALHFDPDHAPYVFVPEVPKK